MDFILSSGQLACSPGGVPICDLAGRSILIYLALLIGLRLTGKREVGQFTLPDLVLVLLVANAVQPAMTGPDTSWPGGIVIMVVLFLLNYLISRAVTRWPRLGALLRGRATVLARDGHWIEDALAIEGVDRDEAEMALREHGVERVDQVQEAVLEIDGSISVVLEERPAFRTRRRLRPPRHLV